MANHLNWNRRKRYLAPLWPPWKAQICRIQPSLSWTMGQAMALGRQSEDKFPWVRLLQTGSNSGCAGGNNAGIRFAMDHGATVISVFNNDTLVERASSPD